MKNKFIIFSFSILLLLIFVGLFYSFGSIFTDFFSSENSNHLLRDDSKKNENGINLKRHSQILKNKNDSDESKIKKNKNEEKIVDQTLKSIKLNAINEESESEKIEIEITLYNGETNNVLKNYEIEIEHIEWLEPHDRRLYVTDNFGKVRYLSRFDYTQMHLYTKDYPVYTIKKSNLDIHKYKVFLYKGGSVEIKATDNNNIILGLESDAHFLVFNKEKGLYVMTNVRFGINNLSFKAKGYYANSAYSINVVPGKTRYIEIELRPIKNLKFNIDINPKPASVTCRVNYLFTNKSSKEMALYKNEGDQYEFLFKEEASPFVSVSIESNGYKSRNINVSFEEDNVDISLMKTYIGKIKIIDSKNEPISGAEVCYFERSESVFLGGNSFAYKNIDFTLSPRFLTGNDGLVLIKDLKEKINLNLTVSHADYKDQSVEWKFSAEDENSKTITLVEDKIISGVVKYNGQAVEGAKLFLFENKNLFLHNTIIISDFDGNYEFNHFYTGIIEPDAISVVAYHYKYGYAKSDSFTLEKNNFEINLNLEKLKSRIVKLVKTNGEPFPFQELIIINNATNLIERITTNKNGEGEILNLFHGECRVLINNEKYIIKENRLSFLHPPGISILTAENRNLKSINIIMPNGGQYNGVLNVTADLGLGRDFLAIIRDENFQYYLNFARDFNSQPITLLFSAPGYSIVRKGPYLKKEDLPDKFDLELQSGYTLKVKVIDNENNKPMKFVTVSLNIGNSNIEALPTNELGEVHFDNLIGNYELTVWTPNYADIKQNIDISESQEIQLSLSKGGGFKGKWTKDKKVKLIVLTLQNGNDKIKYHLFGDFNYDKINPGQYDITLQEYYEDNTNSETLNNGSIKIENNKIIEINLDELLKK